MQIGRLKKEIYWHIPKGIENKDTDTCMPMFTAALFTIAKRWGKKQVSINRDMDKQNVGGKCMSIQIDIE